MKLFLIYFFLETFFDKMTKIIETSFIVSILLGLICNGLGPRIYTIQSSLGVWFDIDIKIIVDYGNDGMIKDGVNITVTGSRGYYTWIGIGFGTEMVCIKKFKYFFFVENT